MEISDCVNFCDCQYNRIIVPCVLSASISCDSNGIKGRLVKLFHDKDHLYFNKPSCLDLSILGS